MSIEQIKAGWARDRLMAKAQESAFSQVDLDGSEDESLAMSIVNQKSPQFSDIPIEDFMSNMRDSLSVQFDESTVDPDTEDYSGGNIRGAGHNSGLSGSYWDKMSNIESGGDYNALNKGSGAHGRWQIMPATSKEYAAKLGLNYEQAHSPAGQDAIIKRFTDDNAKALAKAGLPVNDKTLYLAHQQGGQGAINLLKGKYNKVSDRNIASNNPANVSKSQFANYWMNRMA